MGMDLIDILAIVWVLLSSLAFVVGVAAIVAFFSIALNVSRMRRQLEEIGDVIEVSYNNRPRRDH